VLVIPLATLAVAAEPVVGDGSLDDTLTEEVETTDTTVDDSTTTVEETSETVESDTVDDEVVDADGLLDDADELLDDSVETVEDTTTEVERTVTGEEEQAPADDSNEPAEDGGSTTDESGSSEEAAEAEQQPSRAPESRGAPRENAKQDLSRPLGERRMPTPPSAWQGEHEEKYAEVLGGFDEMPQLPPRAQVDRGPALIAPSVMVGHDDGPTYLPTGGSRSTAPIVDILQRTQALPSAVARVMAPFPVAGLATYGDDWGAPRHPDRIHRGVDVFAARGTPVIASMDGEITGLRHHQGLGGNWLRLSAPDGTYLYYAHLEGFATGIEQGVSVTRGQVLGRVGTSGNARGTPPHLHLQIHPGGGNPVPPVPYLDRWREQAYQSALAFQAAKGGGLAPEVAAPARVDLPSMSTDSSDPGLPATAPQVGIEQTYALDRASTSTTAPATMGVLAVLALFWGLQRRPRRRALAAQGPDDFLERIEVAEPIRPQRDLVGATDR